MGGEPKYRLGSFLVYDHPKKFGEFAWKNREKVEVKRNWGSLFSEDETLFSGPENKITADAIVEKSPLPSASDDSERRVICMLASLGMHPVFDHKESVRITI